MDDQTIVRSITHGIRQWISRQAPETQDALYRSTRESLIPEYSLERFEFLCRTFWGRMDAKNWANRNCTGPLYPLWIAAVKGLVFDGQE